MISLRHARFVIQLSLAWTSLALDVARAEEINLESVRREWAAGAEHLAARFGTARGTAKTWSEDADGSDRGRRLVSQARFAVDGPRRKVELTRHRASNPSVKLGEIIYCMGEGFAFELSKRSGTKDFATRGIGTTDRELARYNAVFARF